MAPIHVSRRHLSFYFYFAVAGQHELALFAFYHHAQTSCSSSERSQERYKLGIRGELIPRMSVFVVSDGTSKLSMGLELVQQS